MTTLNYLERDGQLDFRSRDRLINVKKLISITRLELGFYIGRTANSVFRDYSASVSTDVSKKETGTSCGILSGDLDISVSQVAIHNFCNQYSSKQN